MLQATTTEFQTLNRGYNAVFQANRLTLGLVACGSGGSDSASGAKNTDVKASSDDSGFLGLFGGSSDKEESTGIKRSSGTPTEIGVNSFLWLGV